MNSIQIYSNEDFSVRTMQDAEGIVWFVARDIAEVLDYSTEGGMSRIFGNVPEIWKGGKRIATPGGEQEMLCLTEQGVYFFLGRSDKPKALPYQMWIAGEVLPRIRKTGSYSVSRNTHAIDTEMKALDIERAKILQHMLDAPAAPLSEESRAVIQHEVFKIVTGEQCLSMLPVITEKYYTATELGEMFGVSSKKIGRIAKSNGLKSNVSALDWFREHSELLR